MDKNRRCALKLDFDDSLRLESQGSLTLCYGFARLPTMRTGRLFCQIPLTVLVCVAASLAGAWAMSRATGFTMNISLIAALSAALSAIAIAIELRGTGRS